MTFNSATSGTIVASGSDTINMTYNATGLTDGIYEANITVTSNDADEPSEVVAVTFTVTTGGGLEAPANVVTSISGSDIVLDWDPVTGATGYDVYSSDDPYGAFTLATSVGTNQYTVAASQAKLFYYIVATN